MLFLVRKIHLKLIISPVHELFLASCMTLKFENHNRFSKKKNRERYKKKRERKKENQFCCIAEIGLRYDRDKRACIGEGVIPPEEKFYLSE